MAKAVATTAQEVAKNISAKQMWQWASGCITVCFVCFGVFGWYLHSTAYQAGYNSGLGNGYSAAKNEKAAAAWANTPEGRLAYRFAQSGELHRLAYCQNPGWKVDKQACIPYAKGNSVYGWQLP